MFKFISPNKEETVFEEKVVEIDKKSSPFKEILEKKDFSGFSISLNEQTISLMDSFQLQVNVKSVGTFRFIFNKEGFEKDEIINQVTSLKDIEITDIRTAQNKIDALLSIINKPYLLFMIYEGLDDLYINNDYFHQQMNKDIQTFLIKKEKDNKGMDIADLEAQKSASVAGYYVVALGILIVTIVDKVVLDKFNFGALMSCLFMFSIAFLIKYIKLKKKHELFVSILYFLGAITALVFWILELAKVW